MKGGQEGKRIFVSVLTTQPASVVLSPVPRPPNTSFCSDFTLGAAVCLQFAIDTVSYAHIYPPFSCKVKYTRACSRERKRMNILQRLASQIRLIQVFFADHTYVGLVNYSLSISKRYNLGFLQQRYLI